MRMFVNENYTIFMSDLNEYLIFFFDRYSKSFQMSVFKEICQLGAELFHSDRVADGRTNSQTDMTRLIFGFHSFANAPKI